MQTLNSIDKAPKWVLIFFFCIVFLLGFAILFSLFQSIIFSTFSVYDVKQIFNDDKLLNALNNTFILYVNSIILQIILCVMITMQIHRVANWLKPFLIAPYAMGVIAPCFSFTVLFSPAIGPSVGPFSIGILGTSFGAYIVITLIDTWQWVGVLLLACFLKLENIPPEYFEQATLERLSTVKQWWLIIRPEIVPIILFYCLIRFIDWIRKVDIILIMFGDGGPGYSAETLGFYLSKVYYFSGPQEAYANFMLLIQLVVLGFMVYLFTKINYFDANGKDKNQINLL